MIEYDDFVIQIGPPIDGYHTVTVVHSPAGTGGRGRFPADWRAITEGSTGSPAAGGSADADVARSFRPEKRERPDPTEVGRQLYDALFTGEIESLFEQSLGSTLATGHRLRVRLQLNVENESIAPLATIPWELMYRRRLREHLVLSPRTTLVRSLDVPIGAYDPKPLNESVRVLFVMSNPRGDLNLKAERVEIEARLAQEHPDATGHRPIAPEFLEDATFMALEQLLRDEDFHIIHFMGHGEFDARNQGQLLFHDGPRSGSDLGDMLRRERKTRLVTLNACRTAEASADANADPFAGVATALVMAGVPAVVAMQFPVSDKAAIAFSARLYAALGRGEPLEEAVDSGRMRIKALAADQREWATPVLFLRDVAPQLVFNAPVVTPSAPVAAPVPVAVAAAGAAASAPPSVAPRRGSKIRTLAIGAALGVVALLAFLMWLPSTGDQPQTPAVPAGAPPETTAPTSTAEPLNPDEVRTLEAAAQTDPRDVTSRVRLGDMHLDAELYAQAIKWYQEAIRLDPKNPDLLTSLGEALYRLDQPDPAIEQFEQALALDPEHTPALAHLGIVRAFYKGDPTGAAQAWERVVSLAPNSPEGQYAKESLGQLRNPTAGDAPPAAPFERIRFTLANQTGIEFDRLYVYPNNVDDKGEDRLGSYTLGHGQSQYISFKTTTTSCLWELTATDEKSREFVWRDIDLCGDPSVTLFYSNGQATATVK
jgi:cytochrome c-type biogenesis protein CcmH/NrfG